MYSGIKYVLNRSLPALFSLCCYVVVPDVARELLGRTWRVARWHNYTPMNCNNRKMSGINIHIIFFFYIVYIELYCLIMLTIIRCVLCGQLPCSFLQCPKVCLDRRTRIETQRIVSVGDKTSVIIGKEDSCRTVAPLKIRLYGPSTLMSNAWSYSFAARKKRQYMYSTQYMLPIFTVDFWLQIGVHIEPQYVCRFDLQVTSYADEHFCPNRLQYLADFRQCSH